MGRQPAGLGKWTDVVHELAPVANALPPPPPPLPQPPPAGGGAHNDDNDRLPGPPPGPPAVQPPGPPAGSPGRVPGTLAAGNGATDRNATFREAAQNAGVAVKAAAGSGQSRSQPVGGFKQPYIPGLAKEDQEWKTPGRKKGKNKNRKLKFSAGGGASTANRFEGIGDSEEWETDDEQQNQLVVRTLCASRASYGSRRTVSVADLVGLNKKQASKKRHGSTVEAKEKKKTRKNKTDVGEVDQLVTGVTPQVEVEHDQPPDGTGAGKTTASSEVTDVSKTTNDQDTSSAEPANGAVGDVPAEKDEQNKLLEIPIQMDVGEGGASGGSDLDKLEDTSKACDKPAADKQTGSLSLESLSHNDFEEVELKEKAVKIHTAILAQKEMKTVGDATQH